MIETGGHEFRTLAQPIYLGDGRQICRVFANDVQVYPEMEDADIIKVRGHRTIHASHSHSGTEAEEAYGIGRTGRFSDVDDGYFACSVHFDIDVSFSAVLKCSYRNMLKAKTDGAFRTTDFSNPPEHVWPVDFLPGADWVGRVIDDYNTTGYLYPNIFYDFEFTKMCCPLFGTEPITISNYIETPIRGGSFSDNSFIDADILVSIQMSTPQVCNPVLAGAIWKSGSLGYSEACGVCNYDHLSITEYSANNGVHRAHAIINDTVNGNPNNYPHSNQWYIKNEGFRPHFSSEPAIGNGYVTCGFPSFSNNGVANIRYLKIAGVPIDIGLNFQFPDWAAQYNFSANRWSKSTDYTQLSGITLCEVPIGEFLYIGKYSTAPPEHREPQLSELSY